MPDPGAKRIAEFIKPLRVKPGSKVNLAKDFDPAYKAGITKKKDGVELLQTGIAMLADYQGRLAAQDTYGMLVCLQAPWYVIPADRKWFARICVSAILAHTLIEINPQYPKVSADQRRQLQAIRAELESQAPEGAPADRFLAEAGASQPPQSQNSPVTS